MEMSENIADLATALAKAQAEMESPKKDKEVKVRSDKGSYSFRYATLDSVYAATRPALSKHGLSVFQSDENDIIVTRLLHSSGQYLDSKLPITKLPAKPQEAGSLITYHKRYAYCLALGVVADEDDDGNIASGNSFESKSRPVAVAPIDASTISKQQLEQLQKALEDAGRDVVKFCTFAKIDALPDLPAARFEGAMKAIAEAAANAQRKAA